jgi:hypothetical protein
MVVNVSLQYQADGKLIAEMVSRLRTTVKGMLPAWKGDQVRVFGGDVRRSFRFAGENGCVILIVGFDQEYVS